MNFFHGRLVDGAVEVGQRRLELREELRRRLQADSGEVLIGLRPEEFQDARFASRDNRPVLPATIEITEELGPETYAHFRVDGVEAVGVGERPVELAGALAGRLDPRTAAAPGRRLDIAVSLERVHLFDREDGSSLLAERRTSAGPG